MNELCSVDFYDRQCVARTKSCSVEWNKRKKVRWAARNVCEIFDTSHRARCWSRVDISTSLPHSVVSLTRCHMCDNGYKRQTEKNEALQLMSCTRNCAFICRTHKTIPCSYICHLPHLSFSIDSRKVNPKPLVVSLLVCSCSFTAARCVWH